MNLEGLIKKAKAELEKDIPNLISFKFKDISVYSECQWYVFSFVASTFKGDFSYTINEGKISSINAFSKRDN